MVNDFPVSKITFKIRHFKMCWQLKFIPNIISTNSKVWSINGQNKSLKSCFFCSFDQISSNLKEDPCKCDKGIKSNCQDS